MSADVLIIGGGYAGLAAGALLAHSGYEVQLLEQARVLGGRAGYVERDGFLLEYGLHDNRFASEGAAAAVFKKLGRELAFVEPGDPVLWRNGAFSPLPNNIPKIVRSKEFSAGEKLAAARYLARLVLGNPAKKNDRSLEEVLRGCRSDKIRDLMSVLSGIGIIAPDLRYASAGEFAAFLKKALKAKVKVGYPEGGTRAIIEGLREVIEGNGQVATGARVEKLVPKKGKVGQVATRTNNYTARAVISAVPVQQLPDLFGNKDLPRSFAKAARSLVPTAGISLELALSEPVSGERGLMVTGDPVSMGQFTSNIDPGTAPAGKQLLSWYYPLPLSQVKERERVEKEEGRLRDLLGEMFPGIWDKVEWERVLHLHMVDGFLPCPGQTRFERPEFTLRGLENFFVAGDGTRAEGTGGDTAFYSAIHVSKLVKEYLGQPVSDQEVSD